MSPICHNALLIALWFSAFIFTSCSADEVKSLRIATGERLLVLAPHPDDEVLSAAGIIQAVLKRKGSVRVVIATPGDAFVDAVEEETGRLKPRPADYIRYGELRQKEVKRAIDALGQGRIRLDLLGFPDGGLHPLLIAHWNRLRPERSATTGLSSVTYGDASLRGTPFDGADLHRQLVKILQEERPTLIVFPDAMDWHPDHDGLGMFALLATQTWLEMATKSGARIQSPRLLSYLIHWYHRWPFGSVGSRPVDLSDDPLELPEDLPKRGHERTCYALDPEERQFKRQILAIYQTQQRIMAPLLSAFVRSNECFSRLTRIDAEQLEATMAGRRRDH